MIDFKCAVKYGHYDKISNPPAVEMSRFSTPRVTSRGGQWQRVTTSAQLPRCAALPHPDPRPEKLRTLTR